jgi:hypothetical protein
MATLAETLKEIFGVDRIELTIRGQPLEPLEKLAIINHVMDEMQNKRSKLIIESYKDQLPN